MISVGSSDCGRSIVDIASSVSTILYRTQNYSTPYSTLTDFPGHDRRQFAEIDLGDFDGAFRLDARHHRFGWMLTSGAFAVAFARIALAWVVLADVAFAHRLVALPAR